MGTITDKPFSVENFVELFNNSDSKKFLAPEIIEQIRVAIENKDEELLKRLYPILVTESDNVAYILSDFGNEKRKIADQFVADCVETRKEYVEKPKEKARKAEESKEKGEADKLLTILNQ
jgi:hypothetical protein